jgi:hypothetical protein
MSNFSVRALLLAPEAGSMPIFTANRAAGKRAPRARCGQPAGSSVICSDGAIGRRFADHGSPTAFRYRDSPPRFADHWPTGGALCVYPACGTRIAHLRFKQIPPGFVLFQDAKLPMPWRQFAIRTNCALLSGGGRCYMQANSIWEVWVTEQRFSDVINEGRERLQREREEIFNQQQELENKIADLNRELAAIDAYEAVKTGKQASGTPRDAARRLGRRGGRREGLLRLIGENPQGLTRGEILERMALKGDKSAEMSVSNALTALTKRNQVSRLGGKYRAA